MCWSMYSRSPVPLWHSFLFFGEQSAVYKITSLICTVSIFHIIGRYVMGQQLLEAVPFWGTFWIKGVFLLVIYSSISFFFFFLWPSIPFACQSVADGSELLKPKSMYAIVAGRFPIWYIFESCSEWIEVYFRLRTSSPSNSSSTLFIDSTFFVIIFTNLSTRAGYETRSILKRGLTGLNSEFSFS